MNDYGYGLWPLMVIYSRVFYRLRGEILPPEDEVGSNWRPTWDGEHTLGRQDDHESSFDGWSRGMILTLQSSRVVPA